MDQELWDLMTDSDKLNAYECACQDLGRANLEIAGLKCARDIDREEKHKYLRQIAEMERQLKDARAAAARYWELLYPQQARAANRGMDQL